jgi:hypothetical protein
MKIVLDITRLVQDGKLTAEEAERLRALAARDTSGLAINMLMSFGAIAVAAGVLAFKPSWEMTGVLGVTLVLIGFVVTNYYFVQWGLLGTANVVVGALMTSGGVIGMLDGRFIGFAFSAVLLVMLAIAVRSGLLMALSPLALAGALGSSTGYFHASYLLIVREPMITILVFALLALVGYLASRQVAAVYERLALIFARVSLVLVNFGFWVGSLWGDYPGESWVHGELYAKPADFWKTRQAWRAAALHVPDVAFVILWAALIIGIGIWAARVNRRWVVNMAAVFGAIHFYTQWFERLGAAPGSIIVAGLIVVAVAVGLWRYNRTSMAA